MTVLPHRLLGLFRRGSVRQKAVFLVLTWLVTLSILYALSEVAVYVMLWPFPQPKSYSNSNTDSNTNATMAVVSFHQGFKYHGYTGRFLKSNKEAYARRFGYAYVDESSALLPSASQLEPLSDWHQHDRRDVYYQKPRLLLYLLERYPQWEWILWLDGDAVITFPWSLAEKLQHFTTLYQKKHSSKPATVDAHHTEIPCLVWAADTAPNAGVLLLHNTATSRTLLRTSLRTYEDTTYFRTFTDQASLTTTVNDNSTYQDCQLLLDTTPTLLQSRVRGPAHQLWKPGHWILHLPNHNWIELLRSLRRIGSRIDVVNS